MAPLLNRPRDSRALPPSQATKTLVMTGGTSGFGRRMVERMIRDHSGWRLLLLARASDQADELAARAGPNRLTLVPCDLASLASVAEAVADVSHLLGDAPVDALALNAGLQSILNDQRSADGLELTFAVNHLAHVMIADRLLEHMRPGGRIVITASEVHDPDAFCMVGITRAIWEDPVILADAERAQAHLPERVDRGEARYCASKLLNVMHARHLAQAAPHLASIAFNPSVVPATNIARDRNFLQILGWKYIMPALTPILPGVRSMTQSSGDLLWLLTQADATALTGQYVDGRIVQPGSVNSRDRVKIERTMLVSRELIAAKIGALAPVQSGGGSTMAGAATPNRVRGAAA